MAYGFSITSGTGSTVTQTSADNPPGVFVDSFYYTWSSSTQTYTYSSFEGSTLLPILFSTALIGTYVNISVNNSTKTISITGVVIGSTTIGQNPAYITVLGF